MFGRQCVLRIAAVVVETDVRKHRIACFELRDLASNFFNDPGDVAAKNHGESAVSAFGEHSRPNHPIDRIHARRDDTDEQLIVLRFWSRDVLVF